jgi:hypothetical protein
VQSRCLVKVRLSLVLERHLPKNGVIFKNQKADSKRAGHGIISLLVCQLVKEDSIAEL